MTAEAVDVRPGARVSYHDRCMPPVLTLSNECLGLHDVSARRAPSNGSLAAHRFADRFLAATILAPRVLFAMGAPVDSDYFHPTLTRVKERKACSGQVKAAAVGFS